MSLLSNRNVSDLGYYIRNKKLALSYGNGETPDFSLADGVLIEYTTASVSGITDETSVVDVNDLEKKAVVAYMKMKYFELLGDMNLKEYYEREFRKKLSAVQKAYNPAPRMVVHNGPSALK